MAHAKEGIDTYYERGTDIPRYIWLSKSLGIPMAHIYDKIIQVLSYDNILWILNSSKKGCRVR